MQLTITNRNLNELKADPRNSRRHPAAQIEALARSIKELGWTLPILIDADNTIIAGHARMEAAHTLGLATVPTIQVSHLTPKHRRAFVIAENKLAERSQWDRSKLTSELQELKDIGVDLSLTGFDAPSIADLLSELRPADPKCKSVKCPFCGVKQ